MSSVLLLFTQQVWIMALTVEPAAHWPPEAEYLAVSSQLWAVNTSYWQEGKEALVSRVLALRFTLLLQVAIEESGHQEWELPSWQDTSSRGPWALRYGTQDLLHCWVMCCGYYQYFARNDVYVIFYHWRFACGFQLVPNQSPKTGVLETHRGELSRLPSELRLEAEVAAHTAS